MSDWPVLSEDALYGVAGRFVKKAAPTTEGDPAAILTHFLVAFGNLIGHGPYYELGAEQHTNLFTTIVGQTAFARKYTSWVPVKKFFQLVDSDWVNNCVYSGGFGSGEALIEAVRDPRIGKEGETLDEGIPDKRLFWLDAEFGRTLRIMNRPESVLSHVMRLAWDGGRLESKTRKNPLKASGAHLSMVGHITSEELQELLKPSDYYNGFVNRFLWCMARRSQILCDPPDFAPKDFQPEVDAIGKAVELVRGKELPGIVRAFEQLRRVKQSGNARELWEQIYPPMGKDVPKKILHTITRVPSQIRRIALIQTLLDGSSQMKEVHLRAAKALWDYYQQSAEYHFGRFAMATQTQSAAEMLQRNGKISRTEVQRSIFKNHGTPQAINEVMEELKKFGLGVPGRDRKTATILFRNNAE